MAADRCVACDGEGRVGPFDEPWSAWLAEPIRDLVVSARDCGECGGSGLAYVAPLAPAETTLSPRGPARDGLPLLDELRMAFGVLRDDDASQIGRRA